MLGIAACPLLMPDGNAVTLPGDCGVVTPRALGSAVGLLFCAMLPAAIVSIAPAKATVSVVLRCIMIDSSNVASCPGSIPPLCNPSTHRAQASQSPAPWAALILKAVQE